MSAAENKAVLFRLPASAGTGLVARVVGSELSYASQDAAAAKRICDALRAAGVEGWFDQSELVGGEPGATGWGGGRHRRKRAAGPGLTGITFLK